MKSDTIPSGGLKLEFSEEEARVLRFVAERASFMDIPPEQQEPAMKLAEEILSALGYTIER